MAKAPRNKREGMWDDRLVCRVQQMNYDFRTRTGRLDFPALSALPGQFLIKDLALLGISIWSLGEAWQASQRRGLGWMTATGLCTSLANGD